MILEVLILVLVTLMSTFLFYQFLLSVLVSWVQKKRLREEFSRQMPSMFVKMIGFGLMVLPLAIIHFVQIVLLFATPIFVIAGTYNMFILVVQIVTGYLLYRQYERREGAVGRSIFDQFVRPDRKPEYEIDYITNEHAFINKEGEKNA